MVKINEAIRNLLILKRSQGVSFRMIAKDLNIDPSTVQYIWNKFLKMETVHGLPKRGRPHKCTVQERSNPSLLSLKSHQRATRSIQFPQIVLRDICVMLDLLIEWHHVNPFYHLDIQKTEKRGERISKSQTTDYFNCMALTQFFYRTTHFAINQGKR